MNQFLKRTLFLTTSLVILSSCAKEEFASIKGKQVGSTSEAISYTAEYCAQSTLISPKVDILVLWDNSASFSFVNSQTKASMSNLIQSVSEKFDYHIISAPLISEHGSTSGSLAGSQIIVKNTQGLSSSILPQVTTNKSDANALNIAQVSTGSTESGVSRTINILQNNISNGVFRTGAYTIVVVISNEDDKMCASCSSDYSENQYIDPKISDLLAIRGNTVAAPNSQGLLNSSMMRFISISRLSECSAIPGRINSLYRKTSKAIYNATYTNGWPTSNDHLSPDSPGFPDSYNLCANNFSFSNIFDGVNTAIKQTLLKHKYDYWPLASATAPVDPDTVRVVRSDGTILENRADNPSTTKGFEVILDTNGEVKNTTINTRYFPTAGEPFTGKLIRLYGVEGNDKVVYPDCLTVTYTEPKATYGYIYLKYGKPDISSILVKINGAVVPRENSTNGWDYMGLQYVNSLDLDNFKAEGLPAGVSSGYFLRLNGSAKVQNNTSNTFEVQYNSAAQ